MSEMDEVMGTATAEHRDNQIDAEGMDGQTDVGTGDQTDADMADQTDLDRTDSPQASSPMAESPRPPLGRRNITAQLLSWLKEPMYLVTWLEAQVPEPLDDEVLRTFLLEVWDSVFDIAGRGSEYRLDLECLMSMLRQKVMEDAKGTPITCAGRRVWKDLPTFGRVAVEKYSFNPWDRDSPMSTEDYRRIGYLTDFLASLTMRPEVNEEVTEDPLNFIYFGLWSLRTALERTPSKDGCWCGTVRVAARWIMRAGPKIWLLSEKGHDLPRGAGMGGDKVLSKNWWGFNRERWDFWRRRFAGFRATTADREMLDLLDDVLRDMHALQGNALGTTTPVSEAIVF